MEISPAQLREICRNTGGYGTPELNDRLYLQYKGLKELPSLTAYTGLRTLWGEGNGLTKIDGLQECKQLMSLYLQHNCIRQIENLENCVRFPQITVAPAQHYILSGMCLQALLDTLNLSHNIVRKIEHLTQCTNLKVTCINAHFLLFYLLLCILSRLSSFPPAELVIG
jgi:dynein assembly factor 1